MSLQTPMMKQYHAIKLNHKEKILFFRLGDFYEMFLTDAEEASQLLSLTLTQRQGIPMCGIPYHASSQYIKKLLSFGKTVAICEQLTQPGEQKGIVQRGVVEVLSPGTVVEDTFLENFDHNFVLALHHYGSKVALSAVDVSTGVFKLTEFPYGEIDPILKEIHQYEPKEFLISEDDELEELRKRIGIENPHLIFRKIPSWRFDLQTNRLKLQEHFQVQSLSLFQLEETDLKLIPAGILLDYVQSNFSVTLSHIKNLEIYKSDQYLWIDQSSEKNLEITRNLQNGSVDHTLFSVMNHTRSSQGARLLKQWLIRPLQSKSLIEQRQNLISAFFENSTILKQVRTILVGMPDTDRLLAKVSLDKAHPRDLVALSNGVKKMMEVMRLLQPIQFFHHYTKSLLSSQDHVELQEVAHRIDTTLKEEPAISIQEGDLIREDFSEDVKRLNGLLVDSDSLLNQYLKTEQEKSGLSQLKIKYNKIIGYYFELSKSLVSRVPGHFIRKQSLVGGERYTTLELKGLETEILSAQDQLFELEKRIFLELRIHLKGFIPMIQRAGEMSSNYDVLQSLAFLAQKNHYCRPRMVEKGFLSIVKGRHPVVENTLQESQFVPNDIHFSTSERFYVITGPNMAGKSTFLRQCALITLMAHTGSFIPAESAEIPLTDRIFCRVGASDNLSKGESTFFVEMSEAAHILRSATRKSLIIMDEVGRGTSTHDGLSLAWAISEYIISEIQAQSLFATHYHELTELKEEGVKNLTLAVQEEKDGVIFLKKVVPGAAGNSYGIYVAKLAGIPLEVIRRSQTILDHLLVHEKEESKEILRNIKIPAPQEELFSQDELWLTELRSLEPDRLSPLEALEILYKWKNRIEK